MKVHIESAIVATMTITAKPVEFWDYRRDMSHCDFRDTPLRTMIMQAIDKYLADIDLSEDPPSEADTPTASITPIKHLDADGIEVEVGRLYWVELHTGLRPPAWFQVWAVELGPAGARPWVQVEHRWLNQQETYWPSSERLHRHYPGEFQASKVEEHDKPSDPPEDPAATLNWMNTQIGIMAKTPRSETEDYRIAECPDGHHIWSAWFGAIGADRLHRGTLSGCQAACEALERESDKIPEKEN